MLTAPMDAVVMVLAVPTTDAPATIELETLNPLGWKQIALPELVLSMINYL